MKSYHHQSLEPHQNDTVQSPGCDPHYHTIHADGDSQVCQDLWEPGYWLEQRGNVLFWINHIRNIIKQYAHFSLALPFHRHLTNRSILCNILGFKFKECSTISAVRTMWDPVCILKQGNIVFISFPACSHSK